MVSATLDVNVLVSAVISLHGVPHRIFLAWQAGHFAVITSEHAISELTVKLRLPRIGRRYRIAPDEIEWIETLLRTQARVIEVPPDAVLVVTGDPEDDTVLATARLGEVDYLVTGDAGLLALAE